MPSFFINNYFCVCWKIGSVWKHRMLQKDSATSHLRLRVHLQCLKGILQAWASVVLQNIVALSVGADMTDRMRCFLAHWFCPWFHKLLVSELQEPTECSTFTQIASWLWIPKGWTRQRYKSALHLKTLIPPKPPISWQIPLPQNKVHAHNMSLHPSH